MTPDRPAGIRRHAKFRKPLYPYRRNEREIAVSPVLKNVLLFAVVACLSLLAMEPLTRLFLDTGKLYEVEMWKYATRVKERDYRPDIGHRHRPNARAMLMGEEVRTNAYGFRGPEISDKPAPGVARIAFVGDSITMTSSRARSSRGSRRRAARSTATISASATTTPSRSSRCSATSA
jgi:hypothetical protein